MANTKQSKKRILVNEKKRQANVAVRSATKTALKKALTAVEKSSEGSQEAVREAIRTIDKAASKGIIHKNTAARKKSRLMKKFNDMVAETAKKE